MELLDIAKHAGQHSRRRALTVGIDGEVTARSPSLQSSEPPIGAAASSVRHSRSPAASSQRRVGFPVNVVSQPIGHADVTVTLEVDALVMPGDDVEAVVSADAPSAIP